jgi:phosphatidylglycerophosphatase A
LRKGPILSGALRILATGFGAGYSPLVPGTVGTLVGIPLFLLLAPFGATAFILVLVAVVCTGFFAADHMERHIGATDPGPVVIDEIAGYLLTMAGSPADLRHIAAGFFLFRFFDILKPPPVRQAEQMLPGGVGIMMDDLLAGCYSWLCLRGLEVIFS